MDLLLTKTPAEDIKNSVLPMVYRALEAPSVQIQVKCREKLVTSDLCSCHWVTPFLWMSRSSVWTSSRRLPTWLTTHLWKTPLYLALNQPACRPHHLLWVESCQTAVTPPKHWYNINNFVFVLFPSLLWRYESTRWCVWGRFWSIWTSGLSLMRSCLSYSRSPPESLLY